MPELTGDVTALVLAAGASSRMGSPKAALELAGKTALARIADACFEAGVRDVVVVTGAHDEAVRGAAGGRSVRFVTNPAWERGRTTSLKAGLGALSPGARAFLLWPVDVPLPGADVVRALLAARASSPGVSAWIPSHSRRRGHPALFARATVPRFLALGDDEPAREVVRALDVHHVVVPDESILWDMDTPEDHARLAAEAHERR